MSETSKNPACWNYVGNLPNPGIFQHPCMYAGFLLVVLAQHFPARYGCWVYVRNQQKASMLELCREFTKSRHNSSIQPCMLGFCWLYWPSTFRRGMDAGFMSETSKKPACWNYVGNLPNPGIIPASSHVCWVFAVCIGPAFSGEVWGFMSETSKKAACWNYVGYLPNPGIIHECWVFAGFWLGLCWKPAKTQHGCWNYAGFGKFLTEVQHAGFLLEPA